MISRPVGGSVLAVIGGDGEGSGSFLISVLKVSIRSVK